MTDMNTFSIVLGTDADKNASLIWTAVRAVELVGGGEVRLNAGTHPVTLHGTLRMVESDGEWEGSFSVGKDGGIIGPNTRTPVQFNFGTPVAPNG